MCFTDQISADITINCNELSVGGVEADIVIIPLSDVDKTASTVNSTNDLQLDGISCKSGKTGFKLSGIKQAQGFLNEFVPQTDTFDKWRHTFDGIVATPSVENRQQADKLSKGEPYVVVIRSKYKGNAGKVGIKVLGWDSGVYITAMTENSRERDGAIAFTFSSKDGELEPRMVRTYYDTDEDTSLTTFNNKFATA